VAGATGTGAQPTATRILERVDANMTIQTARTRAKMIVKYREGDVRELEFTSWSRGTQESFLEFTAPARDAGSRFLRRDDAMWIYLPRVGKSVRIQGHMMRQGLMGSDFSYGDASENLSMVDDYEAVIEGEEELDGRPTYVLYLTARRRDLAYQSRRIWVDRERWVPLKEEQFARSGKLLKTALLGDVRRIGERWYPFRVELDNALQNDTSTVLQFLEFEMEITLPPQVFTLRHLEGGP
jgi:outer membrane lipoprotein-sorting protein